LFSLASQIISVALKQAGALTGQLADNEFKKNMKLLYFMVRVQTNFAVTGQLADKPTRSQSSCGPVNSWTSQLAEMFDLKFGVYYSSKCYFRQIT